MSGGGQLRRLVRMHLLKLTRVVEQAIEDDLIKPYQLPLQATIAMENTLIAVRQEALLEGRREGYLQGLQTAREAQQGAPSRPRSVTPLASPPPPAGDNDSTPVRAVRFPGPWSGDDE